MAEPRAEAIIPALVDDDDDVKRYARRILGIEREDDVSSFLTQSLSSEDECIRRAAAIALAQLGDPAGADVLADALTERDAPTRLSAAEALVSLADTRALLTLEGALGDPDVTIRRRSAGLLGALGDSRAVPRLTAALNDVDSRVNVAAVRALGKLDMEEHRSEVLHALTGALEKRTYDSQEDILKGEAARVLGQLGDSRAVQPLLAALNWRYDSDLYQHAAEAIGEIGDPIATPGLLEALNSPREEIKVCVANALGRLGDRRAAGPLISELKPLGPL